MTEVNLHQGAISEEMGSLPPLLTGGWMSAISCFGRIRNRLFDNLTIWGLKKRKPR